MMFENNFWRRISAGLMGAIAVCSLAGSACFAGDGLDGPPGSRQVEYKGKLYPPFGRPTGKEAKWSTQYHYGHYWPYPQNCEDRLSVHNALNAQMNNGWIEATTLFSYHFDPETEQLNTSGQAQLEYILFRTPVQRRQIYVQISPSAQADQARLTSVQTAAGAMLPNGGIPSISMRRARAYGTSAEEVDLISRRYMGGAPTPRLPITGAAAGSGGAGGGGSSSGGSNE